MCFFRGGGEEKKKSVSHTQQHDLIQTQMSSRGFTCNQVVSALTALVVYITTEYRKFRCACAYQREMKTLCETNHVMRGCALWKPIRRPAECLLNKRGTIRADSF